MIKTVFRILGVFYGFFTIKKKLQFYNILFFTIIATFLELVTIGSVIPFIEVLVNTDEDAGFIYIETIPFLKNLNKEYFILIFIFFVIFSGLWRVALLYMNAKFTETFCADLNSRILFNELSQPFSKHLDRNNAEFISILTEKNKSLNTVFQSLLFMISSSLILSIILLIFVVITPFNLILPLIILILFYYFAYSIINKTVTKNSKIINEKQINTVKTVNESLLNFREILISNLVKKYNNYYKEEIYKLKLSQALINILASTPRYFLEIVVIIFMASTIYILSKNSTDLISIFPILAAYAFAMQKTLPYFQQLFTGFIVIKGNLESVNSIIEYASRKVNLIEYQNDDNKFDLKGKIELKLKNFKYKNSKNILFKNLILKIPVGSKVLITGDSGSGKSTLIDILMGFYIQDNISININSTKINRKNITIYQNNISHVPQHVFLLDNSILENISLENKENTNIIKLKKICKKLKINNFIDKLENKYDTFVGENGIRLSGGQKQRVGIARALYKNKKIIFFDEATNALDYKTEISILKNILGFNDLTIFFSTHKTILKNMFNFEINISNDTVKLLPINDVKK